ncbi:uncharacterized protein LOC105262302 [Musca domestica]|uniref:Uncharacterized protein LOC105262302 n=1 Tax=Musca domestica TaxID=7370 RepID=A0A1I8NJQ3_MUSDO|nr:uncharacterized protein LOC105262302 [Musca domestica]
MSSSATSNEDITSAAVTTKSQASLLLLNDDCLELICRQLNTVEQYIMWKLHSRFQFIVEHLWSTTCLHTVQVEDQQVALLSDSDFMEFMQIISQHTVDLSLHYLRKPRFEQLISLRFPKVTILKCIDPFQLHRNQTLRYGLEALRVLQNCFPNIQELELKGYHVRYCRDIFAIGGGNLKRLELKIL